MNPLIDAHLLGWLLVLLAGFQLLPLATAAFYGEPLLPFGLAFAITAVVGASLAASTVPETPRARWKLRPRDSFVVVGLGWLAISVFGALPYVLTDTLGPVDAFFESVAGFTTTGSTVMTRIEGRPHALLLWRSLTQWVGGMGIVLFTIAILPLLSVGGMQLFRAEVPGPVADKVAPRVTETARRLWLVYFGLTAAEALALWAIGGVSPFESICHSFTTLATGGFSTRDASVGAFHSPAVEWIVILFMLAAGMNFVLHYRLLVQRRVGEVSRDPELRYFLFVVAAAAVLIGLALARSGTSGGGARGVLFQTVSILTTTGYATQHFERWPPLAQLVLLALMVLGGMAGSTAGGVKSLRVLLSLQALRIGFARLRHPHVVRRVKYAGRAVSEEVIAGVWAFLTAYMLLAVALVASVAAAGYDLVTAASAGLTAVGNVGPGLGAVGPFDNFAHLPPLVKIVLALGMLAGRLEVFPLLVLFAPGFWRR